MTHPRVHQCVFFSCYSLLELPTLRVGRVTPESKHHPLCVNPLLNDRSQEISQISPCPLSPCWTEFTDKSNRKHPGSFLPCGPNSVWSCTTLRSGTEKVKGSYCWIVWQPKDWEDIFFKKRKGRTAWDCAFPLPLPRPSLISAPTWSMCSTFYNQPAGLGLMTHYTVNVSSTSDPLSMASHARAAIGDRSSINSTQNHKKQTFL